MGPDELDAIEGAIPVSARDDAWLPPDGCAVLTYGELRRLIARVRELEREVKELRSGALGYQGQTLTCAVCLTTLPAGVMVCPCARGE